MIRFTNDSALVAALTPEDLGPFFEGWPVPPSLDRRLAAVRGADHAALAFDGDRVVGLATALSDGALMSSLSLLEVVSSHRGRGIGAELVRRIRDDVADIYGLDVVCDDDVAGFYERAGFHRVTGMGVRRPDLLP
ncbi:MAG: GNAT family N-acetyltransferase [Actinomycetota bacterium]